ncbi:MAG: LacI family DNA-binding transcriptional regulator [Leptothrix sp. (in: b-proteobacteria)]
MSGLPRGRRPTIADVARAAGVSLSTVDRVLNARAPVRSDTAEQIHAAAESLGYHAAGVIRERVRGSRPRRTLGFLLQQPESGFYRGLARALTEATESDRSMQGQAVVEYMTDISPEAVAARIAALGQHVDALAVVAADHALISVEIDRLNTRGVPVFALVSDLSAPARAGYAGLDHRRVGRTAAWFVTRLARRPGQIAIFVGSHRFQCQELCEMSFRSYVREHAPQFEVLEPLVTLESERLAEEGMHELLQRHPDLVGFYVAGGGVEGVLRALAAERADGLDSELIGVGHEFMADTRAGLLAGHLHAVLSVPLALLAERLVARMAGVLANPALGLQQVVVPLDTQTPESG